MHKRFKLLTGIIILILLFSTISYVIVFLYSDNEAPNILDITGDITAVAGTISSIFVEFTDNVEVTKAVLYYRQADEEKWMSKSIIEGIADIKIPSDSVVDFFYYVVVDDAAGNGPVGLPSIDGSKYYVINVVKEKKLVHNVFIEEASTTGCVNCPNVAKVIHNLYDSGEYNFFYVSMVADKNDLADSRLKNAFNTYGYPSVYIDGGYRFLVGQSDFKSKFSRALSEANARSRPQVYVYLESIWDEKNSILENTIEVVNKGNESYSGTVRLYICENRSVRWSDHSGDAYRFAFLEYGLEESVDLKAGENITFKEKWIPKDSSFSDVSAENLWMVAVVFNDEGFVNEYDLESEERTFKAFYADDSYGTNAVSGDLPPSIGLVIPKQYSNYIRNRERKNLLFQTTYIIGKLNLEVNVEADSGVEKVEYIIEGPRRTNTQLVYDEPFSYRWDRFSFGRHTITVRVYDKEGRTATDSIEVFAFIL